jgi:type IV pilus assembly protein PilF
MKRLLPVLLAAALAGCITETRGVFSEQASPEKVMEQRVALARRYIGEGNWEDAKRNLQAAVAINDRNAEVYEAFALVYQSTGEYELAEESFERAISIDRKFSRARNNYAAFLYSRERYSDAEAQLEQVVADTLYNARPQAFINLGVCRLHLDKPDAAQQAFERALTMQPRSQVALLELGLLRLEKGDTAAASIYYERYRASVRQQSARGLWLGARLARATGDQDAESSYALALRNLYPKSAEYAAYQRSLESAESAEP